MLTEELILSKNPGLNDISNIRTLKINLNDISDISIISKIKKLEYLSLSSNRITSLYPLSKCENLRELNIRNNKISSFEELYFLKNLKKLNILFIDGNPICCDNNYIDKILEILPNLTNLDNRKISRNNRNRKNKYMKRILTEEKKLGLEYLEDNCPINYSNINHYSDKKKILLKKVISNLNETNENIVTTTSSKNKSRNNNIIKNLKFINNYYDKGKSERKKDINFINLKMKFKKSKRTIYNNILINNYFQKCPKHTVEVNSNNKNTNIKKLKFNSNNTPQSTLVYQNSLDLKNSDTNNTNFLFKRKNVLNKDAIHNIKYLKLLNNNKKNINEDNNYVEAVSLLINRMNMQELISLKKVINRKIEILTK